MKIMDQDFAAQYAQKIKAMIDAGIITTLIGNHFTSSRPGKTDLDGTIEFLKELKCESVLTHNREGAYHIQNGDVFHQTVNVVNNPKNTTGAGDQFMAGFLMGKTGWKIHPRIHGLCGHLRPQYFDA